MAAEFRHQFFAFAELLIHRIRFDRAAGALDALLTSGEYEGWFVEVLPQATCDDSGKTLVTVRQIDDEDFVVLQRGGFHELDCFRLTLARQLFAAFIQVFQVPGKLCGLLTCLCAEQF